MPSERRPLVALISDLGVRDPALAQFRAAVLTVNPVVEFCDVTHDVRPRDLLEAAFTLERTYRSFPTRTIFVVLVDLVLGAPRRPLLAVSMDYYYFAPDNGVLSYVYETDQVSNVYHVTAEHYVDQSPGCLALHRDVYGRAVGWLSKGIESSNFGDAVTDHVRTPVPQAARTAPAEIRGVVLHVDRYGTLVTNVPEALVGAVRAEVGVDRPFRAVIGDAAAPVVGSAAGLGDDVPVVGVFGPSGFLEVISPKRSASEVLSAQRGAPVTVVFG